MDSSTALERIKEVDIEKLTPRQREIVKLLAVGFDGPAIAQKLYIEPGSVNQHMYLARLGTCGESTTMIVAAWAIQQYELYQGSGSPKP